MLKAGNFEFPLGKRTYIMGILNCTPDSFSDGGLYNTPETALERALEMQAQGADIIDIGANSTRPSAQIISASQELERLMPILEVLKGRLEVPISADTFYPSCAEAALKSGVSMINDVSGEFNGDMARLAKKYNAAYVVMHNPCGAGTVKEYKNGVVCDIREFFLDSMRLAAECGLPREQLCLDPGIGFSKSTQDNFEIIQNLEWLKFKEVALLFAASRKRFIGEASGEANSSMRDSGTIAADTAAISCGADIIRVHDVRGAVQAARTADRIYRGEQNGHNQG